MSSSKEPELPWERQPGEGKRSFEDFIIYRDMPKRSVRKVAAQVGKAYGTVEWSSKRYNWTSRVNEFDKFVDQTRREENEQAIKEMLEKHCKIGTALIAKATNALAKLTTDNATPSDIVKMFELGVKIERLSRGETTEKVETTGKIEHTGNLNVQVNTAGFDISKLTDKELEDFEQLLAKSHPKPDVQPE